MKKIIFFIFSLFIIFLTHPVQAYQEALFEINLRSPSNGEAVQGLVTIIGSSDTENLDHYNLSFSSSDSTAPTWFLILDSSEKIKDGPLAEWDTSIISDGNYQLRLIAYLKNQDPIILTVDSIRVRNYTPIETPSPSPNNPSATAPMATATNATIVISSPTPLANNPLAITKEAIKDSISMGIGISLLGLVLVAAYTSVRQR